MNMLSIGTLPHDMVKRVLEIIQFTTDQKY